MISDVIITGFFRKKMRGHRKFRIFETSSMDVFTGKTVTSHIPILHWTREANNVMDRIEEGTLAIIKGRIETDEVIGLYVLVEMFQLGDKVIFS